MTSSPEFALRDIVPFLVQHAAFGLSNRAANRAAVIELQDRGSPCA